MTGHPPWCFSITIGLASLLKSAALANSYPSIPEKIIPVFLIS